MLLLPNDRFAEPFEWDMSGLHLLPDEDGSLRIDAIVGGSPAAQAGLESGDTVTHVDGRPVSAGDLFAIRDRMKRAGGTVAVTALRDGAPLEAKLTLRRLV
jgi:S1-C subfamily serine protease